MKQFFRFQWLCVIEAWGGSLEIANAWSGLWGPILVWAGSYWWGHPLKLPEQLDAYAIMLALSFVVATWLSFFLVRLVGAPARLYQRLKATIPPVLESNIKIVLSENMAYEGGLSDATGNQLPPAHTFVVRVVNGGDRFLQKCQLTFGQKTRMNYPVSGCFDLRQGEYRDLPVLRVNARSGDPRAFVYLLEGPDWIISAGGPSWLTGPGTYEIRVLSADTNPASLDVELSRIGNEWRLECATAGSQNSSTIRFR
jgi:hypothetical protein